MRVTFAADSNGRYSRSRRPRRRGPETRDLGHGWVVRYNQGTALLKPEARLFAAALRDRVARGNNAYDSPWAVRGEVPLDDTKCSCVRVVFNGVRKHLPEKIFGDNWLELTHSDSGACLYFEPQGALQAWARGSLGMIDEGRAGRRAWSGRCDGHNTEAYWSRSLERLQAFRRHSGNDGLALDMPSILPREEYDWSYSSTYCGEVRRGGAGACQSLAASRSQHSLVRLVRGRSDGAATASGEEDSDLLDWRTVSEEHIATQMSRTAQDLLSKVEITLFEDYLSELGLTALRVCLEQYARGWQVQLRWHCCINPTRVPKRGRPHIRIRDVIYRYVAPSNDDADEDEITRAVDERELSLDAEKGQEVAEITSLLDPDVLVSLMPLSTLRTFHAASLLRSPTPPTAEVALAASGESECKASEVCIAATLGQVTVMVVDNGSGLVAAASASGALVLFAPGSQPSWFGTHRGVESMVFSRPGRASGPSLLLSSGSDGHVRSWTTKYEAPELAQIDALALGEDCEGADRFGEDFVIQCVGASQVVSEYGDEGPRIRAAAACGREVVPIDLGSGGALIRAESGCPALPSHVTALGFSSCGVALVAATSGRSGIFVWLLDGSTASAATGQQRRPFPLPSLRLPCDAPVLSCSLSRGADGSSLWCAARCQRTARLWRVDAVTAAACRSKPPSSLAPHGKLDGVVEGERPLTFGGLRAAPLVVQGGSGVLLVQGRTQLDVKVTAPPALFFIEDRQGGLVRWDLTCSNAVSDVVPCSSDALGVDSRRASRMFLPQATGASAAGQKGRPSILCASLSPHKWPHTLVACGYADGSVVVVAVGNDPAFSPAAQRLAVLPGGAISAVAWSTAKGSCWLYAVVADGGKINRMRVSRDERIA